MPRVAIIVLIYNVRRCLNNCFSSLKKLDYPQEDLEIIAIDNNSTEDTVGLMKKDFPEIKLIESKVNLGYAGGNNLVIKYALEKGFDYCFILNHDTVVEPDSLKKLVAVAESDKEVGIVQPKILFWQDKTKIQTSGNKIHYLGFCYSGDYKKKDYLFGEPREIAYASGAGMLVKKEVFKKIGLLDADYFMYHEDADFGWLARLFGYKILVVPQAIIYHDYSFSRSKKKYFWMEKNRFWLMVKNYKIKTLILITPALILMEIGLLFYSLLSGWFFWKLRAYLATIIGLPKFLRKRKIVQKQRIISDRAFAKNLIGVVKFEDIDNLILKIANIFFNLYWKIIKRFI